MRNCFCFTIVLLIGWVPTLGQAPNRKTSQLAEPTLPPLEVWSLLRRGDLSIVTRVEELPKSVRSAPAQVLHQASLKMGDRDHKVNAHCSDCLVFRLIFCWNVRGRMLCASQRDRCCSVLRDHRVRHQNAGGTPALGCTWRPCLRFGRVAVLNRGWKVSPAPNPIGCSSAEVRYASG